MLHSKVEDPKGRCTADTDIVQSNVLSKRLKVFVQES